MRNGQFFRKESTTRLESVMYTATAHTTRGRDGASRSDRRSFRDGPHLAGAWRGDLRRLRPNASVGHPSMPVGCIGARQEVSRRISPGQKLLSRERLSPASRSRSTNTERISTMTTRGAGSGEPMERLSATERLKALLPNPQPRSGNPLGDPPDIGRSEEPPSVNRQAMNLLTPSLAITKRSDGGGVSRCSLQRSWVSAGDGYHA